VFAVIVSLQTRADDRKAFLAAAVANAESSTQEEPGCRRFDVVADDVDPSRVWLYELYDDEGAYTAHQQTAHYRIWRRAVEEYVIAGTQRVQRGTLAVPPPRSASAQPTFREVLGHFPSSITVITGLTDEGPVGFTCQSFSSLSLDPPLVVVLPGRSSTSWPRIAPTGRFCVNILAEDQEALSATFARSATDKFGAIGWTPSPSGLPILDRVCAWIDCEIGSVHPGGDHLIVVGAVHDLATLSDSRPLLYHRGDYAASAPLRIGGSR
jgi:flavin reductase (DIM6/NTAB) family NADH-FMN oxidoreductase RutF/quinol monooxygenase YgiN